MRVPVQDSLLNSGIILIPGLASSLIVCLSALKVFKVASLTKSGV